MQEGWIRNVRGGKKRQALIKHGVEGHHPARHGLGLTRAHRQWIGWIIDQLDRSRLG